MSDVAILTGCASGIGKALASELVGRGLRVVATDFDQERLKAAAEEQGWVDRENVLLERLDVRDAGRWEEVLRQVVDRWGSPGLLMNVAGVLFPEWAHEVDAAAVDRTIDINVKGTIHGTGAALRYMIPARRGHVVNVASMAGVVPVPGLSVYAASKHAVRGYSLSVALETREHGVFVTAVCPGVVATPMMDLQLDREEANLTFTARPLTPEQVVRAIVDDALVRRPLELLITSERSQAVLGKVSGAFPGLMARFGGRVRNEARKAREKLRVAATGAR